ncbi:hypothetical protein NECAME_18164 [Necator americanus]|uniref:BTB domain-containing protein n=1 Tax=Necator americanus TaxID=51031 RepID=W2TAR1_NECAM|nr:hypothetical protein NECAME_18164 [Necator americanus]ETN79125.1 hypothetical protein NECAME_18164 [Necator americanus]
MAPILDFQRFSHVQDLEMVEDAPCQKVFPAFLRFLYCNHVVLHQDNCLPILILADKYNVISLKKPNGTQVEV